LGLTTLNFEFGEALAQTLALSCEVDRGGTCGEDGASKSSSAKVVKHLFQFYLFIFMMVVINFLNSNRFYNP